MPGPPAGFSRAGCHGWSCLEYRLNRRTATPTTDLRSPYRSQKLVGLMSCGKWLEDAATSGFLSRGEAVSSAQIEHVNAHGVMLACLWRYSADGRFVAVWSPPLFLCRAISRFRS
jgi:hypothetical protein